MRRLRRMRHLDDLAAQPRRLELQCAGIGLPGGLPDCNVHRRSPVTRPEAERLVVRVCVRISLAVSADRCGNVPPSDDIVDALFERDSVSRQPSSVRSLRLSSV